MLVSCPGCGKRVSDRAPSCPFCARPLAPSGEPAASVAPAAAPASIGGAPPAPPSVLPVPPPATSPPALPGRYARGDSIGDAFRVLDVLGEGGFGIVYRVHPKGSAESLALKTIRDEWLRDPATRDMFRKEAELWVALGRHPFLVRAERVHEDHGRLFIAMEYVAPDGRGINDVQGHLEKDPPGLDRALRWAIEACHGLEYAYSRGIRCHRDIKPQNLLVGEDGSVRVTDFGIAGLVAPGAAGAALPASEIDGAGQTVAGAAFGTPTHMPPEQFADAASCDERSDVYSLGVVLYQMAARGALPFLPAVPAGPDAGRRAFFALRRLHEEAVPPPLASPVWPIVERCLRKKREDRYPGVAALRADLEALLRERTGEAVAMPAPQGSEADELCVRGMSLASLGDDEGALACYDRALSLAPAEPALHNNRGNSLSRLGRHDEALAAFARALELRPRYDSALVNRALALVRAGRTEEALPDCDRALAMNARSSEGWTTRGAILGRLRRPAEAVSAYDRALEIDPRDAVAWGNRAGNLLELGRHDEAVAAYDRALSISPRSAELWIGKGTALAESGRNAEAVPCHDEGLRLDRANARGWYNRGNALLQLERYEEALASFRESARLAPGVGLPFYNCGVCELVLERPQEARRSLARYLELDPGDELAGEARALLEGIESGRITRIERTGRAPKKGRLRTGESAEAVETADAAGDGATAPAAVPPPPAATAPVVPAPRPVPRLGPSADRLNREAKERFGAGRFEECAALSRQALDLEPWNAVAWGNLANALFRLGRPEESIAAFDRAFACDSPQVDQWASRAAVEQMSGRRSEALRSCQQFLALAGPGQQAHVSAIEAQARAFRDQGVAPAPPLPAGLVHEGVRLGAAGRFREAIASFDRALAAESRQAAAWVWKAQALVQLKEADAAVRVLEQALAVLPEDPRVWHRKGVLLASRRRFEEAVACFDRALASEPRHAAAWSDRGKYLGALKRYEEAVESLEKAAALAPDAPAPWQNKALAEEALGRSADAVLSYRAFLERAQPGQELQVEAAKDRLAILEPLVREAHPGRAALQEGRYDEALPLLRRAASSPRADATDWANLGLCLARLRRANDALEAYDQALALDAGHVAALTNKAALLDRQGSDVASEIALDLLIKAAAAAGDGEEASIAWTNLGHAFAARGIHGSAADALARAVAASPRNAEAHEGLADALARTGRPRESLASAEASLALDSSRPHAWYLRANALAKLGRREDSIADYDRAIALDPGKANAHFNKAFELFALGRHAEVPAPCEEAVRLHPGFGWAEDLHAQALEALGRPDEALVRYDRALAIEEGSVDTLRRKGLLLRRLKRYPHAVATLDLALAVRPNDASVLSLKADCLEESGHPYEAAQAWQRWLALVPGTHPDAPRVRSKLQTLARQRGAEPPPLPAPAGRAPDTAGVAPAEALKRALFCQNQGQHDRALAFFDACLASEPGNVTALGAKGESLRVLGRHADALPCFEAALGTNPGHAPTWIRKGACLEQLRRFEEALAAYDRAAECDPGSAVAWTGRGVALGRLGRVDEAVASLEKALGIDPRSPLPRLHVAELFDRLDRREEAAKAYQQFLGVASPVLLAAESQRARARLHELRGGGR